MKSVPHHLLDVANPEKVFTVAKYKTLAEKAILRITSKSKTPIVCGGTGFYIQALVDNIILPDVPPNKSLRKKLSAKTSTQLFAILKKIDPTRAKNIDPSNNVRMIRAIEVAKTLGEVPALISKPKYNALLVGIKTDSSKLKEQIASRLQKRFKQGMTEEVINLHKNGLSWKRMEGLGLEYRYISRFLQGKISEEEMLATLLKEIQHYAKRQMTWFKRDKRIIWHDKKEIGKISTKVKKFLRK